MMFIIKNLPITRPKVNKWIKQFYFTVLGGCWREKVVSDFGFGHSKSHFRAPENVHPTNTNKTTKANTKPIWYLIVVNYRVGERYLQSIFLVVCSNYTFQEKDGQGNPKEKCAVFFSLLLTCLMVDAKQMQCTHIRLFSSLQLKNKQFPVCVCRFLSMAIWLHNKQCSIDNFFFLWISMNKDTATNRITLVFLSIMDPLQRPCLFVCLPVIDLCPVLCLSHRSPTQLLW